MGSECEGGYACDRAYNVLGSVGAMGGRTGVVCIDLGGRFCSVCGGLRRSSVRRIVRRFLVAGVWGGGLVGEGLDGGCVSCWFDGGWR